MKKFYNYIMETPHAAINDGDDLRDVEDFFSELHGKKVLKSQYSDDYVIFDWIDNLVDFYETKKWRMIKSHNNKPYFLPNEDFKPYSPEEMKKWTDEFVQNKSFMMQLLATLTAEGREHWFIAQKHIPLIIKETIFPYLKKKQ